MKLYLISSGNRCHRSGKNNQTLKFNKIIHVAGERAGERTSKRARNAAALKKKLFKWKRRQTDQQTGAITKKKTGRQSNAISFFLFIYIWDSSWANRWKPNIRGETNKQLRGWSYRRQEVRITTSCLRRTHNKVFMFCLFSLCVFLCVGPFLFLRRWEQHVSWGCSASSGGNLHAQ